MFSSSRPAQENSTGASVGSVTCAILKIALIASDLIFGLLIDDGVDVVQRRRELAQSSGCRQTDKGYQQTIFDGRRTAGIAEKITIQYLHVFSNLAIPQ